VTGRTCHGIRYAAVAAAVSLSACNSSHDEKSSAIAAIASESIAVRAAPPPVPSVPAVPEKPAITRPRDPGDLLVTSERRARAEAAHPEAKGFLTSAGIEEKLYEMQLRRGKDADAVKAIDGLAAGKWVVFTGNIGNVTPAGFELPIRYTPKDPNDSLGLTSVWVSVKLTNISGYDASEYRQGELAVVLAKYSGKQKAEAGWDLILLRQWF
jgi:hypothetical protein